jgi:hypothetical protein
MKSDLCPPWELSRSLATLARYINHQEAYSVGGACTKAEEYFSRLRRDEIGIHRHIAGLRKIHGVTTGIRLAHSSIGNEAG